MAVERSTRDASLVDVLDRVLDKGVVIDAWVRALLVGVDLITARARVVVESIDTCLRHSQAVGRAGSASLPALASAAPSETRPPKDDSDDGNGGQGSSGTPAFVRIDIEPRRHAPRPRRTRRR